MNVSENIKNGIFYNSNPDLNPRAVALWTIGTVKLGEIIWLKGQKWEVTETDLRVRHNGKLYKHGIMVRGVKHGLGTILVNANEKTDFNSIWME